jgi:NitT/TauT family transport system substrate-binding protein
MPVALGTILALAGAACSSSKATTTTNNPPKPVTLRLGYFPNLTHAAALVGVQNGIFAKDLGANVTLRTQVFNAGPAEVTALLSGGLDAGYIGPSPAINAWSKSKAIHIIAGATSGGAALVVASSITTVAQLKGKKIATPQLGNTQDVALRAWLKSEGYATSKTGAGDVQVVPQDNSLTLQTFKQGIIAGAWVPEPYASRLVVEEGGHVLVDEASLWPGGKYTTTDLVVSDAFLKAHADVVQKLLAGHIEATDYLNQHPADAQTAVNAALQQLSGKSLKAAVIERAWKTLTFTVDPLATTLQQEADHAAAAGLITTVDLTGLVDVGPLNAALVAAGRPPVGG